YRLVNRLDDDLCVGGGAEVGAGLDPAGSGLGVLLRDGALAHHPLQAALHGAQAAVDSGPLLVDEAHLMARQRARLGDAGAHRPGPDDGYLHDRSSSPSDLALRSKLTRRSVPRARPTRPRPCRARPPSARPPPAG